MKDLVHRLHAHVRFSKFRRHNKEGGNHLEQESNRQKTMEGTDGGLHPAVDGQSLGER